MSVVTVWAMLIHRFTWPEISKCSYSLSLCVCLFSKFISNSLINLQRQRDYFHTKNIYFLITSQQHISIFNRKTAQKTLTHFSCFDECLCYSSVSSRVACCHKICHTTALQKCVNLRVQHQQNTTLVTIHHINSGNWNFYMRYCH